MDIPLHPVSSVVWIWQPILGRSPIAVTVKSVCVWLDHQGTDISYSFVSLPDGKRLGGRLTSVFASYEAACRDRDTWLAALRDT